MFFVIFIDLTAFLGEDQYTVSEVVGTLEVCIVLDGFIDREVTVNLSTIDGTAIGIFYRIYFFIDFQSSFMMITFVNCY